MLRAKAILSWSGGKDSSLALQEASRSADLEVALLLTTLTRDFDRVSMHGVRRVLLNMQARSLRLPLDEVWIGKGASNVKYSSAMHEALLRHRARGLRRVVFGDLFLEDIRRFREDELSKVAMEGVFPLWMKDTKRLAAQFVKDGFKAVVCTVDPKALDRSYCGREFDESFLSDLPPSVDPCGENGEFHTFVYDGPMFEKEVPIRKGGVVLREGFYFADILPG
ncbi:MAG: adenine nucleotide alpha hydrolase [Nitrososphaerota archaeon]|nr:adenine nucleotide alpha hydrolase [Nitrososphaerota archaeon]MDG6903305.1 adenine nucleotide alpha hydrolase [Nitrososphaerota archaeon]MDG6911833.1 adenine nucleotide alpha hydrolase [Nitrososphaerota archaeon]MDG6940685.1 adenine nucleotide alpha hydrolase [Nitrososphaerota archaeon]MDG6960996.1 adenine nucleotide alpha hydrolase [Nitrososphaerota archaeon]